MRKLTINTETNKTNTDTRRTFSYLVSTLVVNTNDVYFSGDSSRLSAACFGVIFIWVYDRFHCHFPRDESSLSAAHAHSQIIDYDEYCLPERVL